MSASLSGGKDSVKPESHLKHITDDVGSMKSWPSDCHMGQKEGRIVLYVLGTTTTAFWKIWENLYKPYKAAAGADAEPFPSYANLSAAHKKDRASRLGRESKAYGYVPHNNNVPTQAARRAEGIYDGADLFAALTGIGQ